MVKFEKVTRVADKQDVKLPMRATAHSAGYDFFAYEDVTLSAKQLTRVSTGIKCELMPGMVLILANRSSNPSKKHLFLSNGIGVIDADYYNNPDNEGEIIFEFYNNSEEDVVISVGEKIGQGIITRFLKTENDFADGIRQGGFGSTNNK
jgi:dUTP pyrophosphatase